MGGTVKLHPRTMVRFHAGATGTWVTLAIPTVMWWSTSILWVGLMSIWANVAGHWSAWQASRAEVEQTSTRPDPALRLRKRAARPAAVPRCRRMSACHAL